jgi:hypothetical protein
MSLVTEPRTAAMDLLGALARRDFDGVADCLADEVRFRALLPPGLVELEGSGDVAERFRTWFGHDDDFELLSSDVAQVGAKVHVRWLVRVGTAGQPTRLAEQTVLATVGDRIETMDLLCTGWQVVDG